MVDLNLNFPNDFFEEEIRDEYQISCEQKKIWAVELDLFSELLRVCEKYNLKVFAWGGTLLGAVRHGGFIPWDDDMDICMCREDYEKLAEVASFEFSEPYFYQTAYTDKKYFVEYARLRNSNTTGIISWNKSPDYNNGIYIDIIVMDDYIQDNMKLFFQMKMRSIASVLCYLYTTPLKEQHGVKKVLACVLKHTFFRFVNYDSLIKNYENVLKMYHGKSDRVSQMFTDIDTIRRQWGYKTEFSKVRYVDYENIKMPIPEDYDHILRHFYGDYLKFPPVEERGTWHEGIIYFNPDISYKEYLQNCILDEKGKK